MASRGTVRAARAAVWTAVAAALLAPGSGEAQATHRLSLFTGVGITADADLAIRQPERGTSLLFRDAAFDDKSLENESAPYLGLRWTRSSAARPWLELSFEFLHFKIFTETERSYAARGTYHGAPVDGVFPMNAVVQQYDVANGVNLLLANAARRWAGLAGGRMDAYLGAGAGLTVPYTKATIDGEGGDGRYEVGRIGGQLFAGLLWPVAQRWDVFVEGKWTRTTVDGSVPGGSSEADLSTRHLTAGVGYRF